MFLKCDTNIFHLTRFLLFIFLFFHVIHDNLHQLLHSFQILHGRFECRKFYKLILLGKNHSLHDRKTHDNILDILLNSLWNHSIKMQKTILCKRMHKIYFYYLKPVIVILLAKPLSYKTNNYVLCVFLKFKLSSRPKHA